MLSYSLTWSSPCVTQKKIWANNWRLYWKAGYRNKLDHILKKNPCFIVDCRYAWPQVGCSNTHIRFVYKRESGVLELTTHSFEYNWLQLWTCLSWVFIQSVFTRWVILDLLLEVKLGYYKIYGLYSSNMDCLCVAVYYMFSKVDLFSK